MVAVDVRNDVMNGANREINSGQRISFWFSSPHKCSYKLSYKIKEIQCLNRDYETIISFMYWTLQVSFLHWAVFELREMIDSKALINSIILLVIITWYNDNKKS